MTITPNQLAFIERHGITDYTMEGKNLRFYETFASEPFSYKVLVSPEGIETRKQLKIKKGGK